MPGLLDHAPATFDVAGVTGPGVSSAGVAFLLTVFPELKKLMTGMELKLGFDEIVALAPNAIAAIIANGCGYTPGASAESLEQYKLAEAKAASLNVGSQIDIIDAILKITMPGGAGPFVEKLEKMGDFVGAGFGNIAVSNSPPQS